MGDYPVDSHKPSAIAVSLTNWLLPLKLYMVEQV